MATAAGGTHPTRMHSCWHSFLETILPISSQCLLYYIQLLCCEQLRFLNLTEETQVAQALEL